MAVAGVRGEGPADGSTSSLVIDLQLQLVGEIAHLDRDPGAAGVLHRVRNGFLHDPVGGQIESRRYRPLLPFDPELDGHTRLAHLRDETVQLAESRLRDQCPGNGPAGAQEPHQTAHLQERFATRVLDRGQRPDRLVRPLVGDPLRRGRLRDDHAHIVRDHVVELPRDDSSFRGDRLSGVRFSLSFEPRGAILQLHELAPTDPAAVADEPRRRNEEEGRDDRVGLHGLRPEPQDQQDDGAGRDPHRDRRVPFPVRGHRVERQQKPERRERAHVSQHRVQEQRRGDDRQDQQRRTPAPGHWRRLGEHERDPELIEWTGGDVRSALRQVDVQIVDDAHHGRSRQRRGDHGILEERTTADGARDRSRDADGRRDLSWCDRLGHGYQAPRGSPSPRPHAYDVGCTSSPMSAAMRKR